MNRTAQADDLDALMALAPHHPDARRFEAWLGEALKRRGQPDGVTLASVPRPGRKCRIALSPAESTA